MYQRNGFPMSFHPQQWQQQQAQLQHYQQHHLDQPNKSLLFNHQSSETAPNSSSDQSSTEDISSKRKQSLERNRLAGKPLYCLAFSSIPTLFVSLSLQGEKEAWATANDWTSRFSFCAKWIAQHDRGQLEKWSDCTERASLGAWFLSLWRCSSIFTTHKLVVVKHDKDGVFFFLPVIWNNAVVANVLFFS